jgi:hypothetical protein
VIMIAQKKIKYFDLAWSKIKSTPQIERHIYKNAGHVWDYFPLFP